MRLELHYIQGCPNWRMALNHLEQAIVAAGCGGVSVQLRQISTYGQAERAGFTGSPTILIDGNDPFGLPGTPTGLACRVYRDSRGVPAVPTVDQLEEVLRARLGPCRSSTDS